MSAQNQYISNCISRIFTSKIHPSRHKFICDQIADVFDIASTLGIEVAHLELSKLLADTEKGKFQFKKLK